MRLTKAPRYFSTGHSKAAVLVLFVFFFVFFFFFFFVGPCDCSLRAF